MTEQLPNRTDIERIARKRGLDPDDLYQDVTLLVLRSDGPRDVDKFDAWVSVIAKRQAFDLLRRNGRRPETSVEFLEETEEGSTDPVAEAIEHERAEKLVETVRELRPMDFQVLNEFYCYGRGVADIAAIEGVPIGTIKRRLHTARARLEKRIEEKYPR